MLTLYYKPTCPFSQRVLGEVEDMGVKLNLKNIAGDEVLTDELIQKGGKKQTPFLEDTDRDESLYESNDIIAYLQNNYADKAGATSFNGLRIHRSEESCDTCQ